MAPIKKIAIHVGFPASAGGTSFGRTASADPGSRIFQVPAGFLGVPPKPSLCGFFPAISEEALF
jgi:hypothetical protein